MSAPAHLISCVDDHADDPLHTYVVRTFRRNTPPCVRHIEAPCSCDALGEVMASETDPLAVFTVRRVSDTAFADAVTQPSGPMPLDDVPQRPSPSALDEIGAALRRQRAEWDEHCRQRDEHISRAIEAAGACCCDDSAASDPQQSSPLHGRWCTTSDLAEWVAEDTTPPQVTGAMGHHLPLRTRDRALLAATGVMALVSALAFAGVLR